MIDVRGKRWGWVLAVVAVAAVAAVVVAARSGTATDAEGAAEPARVQPVKGTDVSRVLLSADAARRLGIETGEITRVRGRTIIPYDAVLYAADGSTFTYTSPQPRVFVRQPIRVADIRGDRALLADGPPVGTAVVTIGSQELFGTEYEVEED